MVMRARRDVKQTNAPKSLACWELTDMARRRRERFCTMAFRGC